MPTYHATQGEHAWSWAVTAGMWMPSGRLADGDPAGVWLLSDNPCSVVHIRCSNMERHASLALDLRDRPNFFSRNLEPGSFTFFLACPEHVCAQTTHTSPAHVLLLGFDDGNKGQTVLSLLFHARHAGMECTSILQVWYCLWGGGLRSWRQRAHFSPCFKLHAQSAQRGMLHMVPAGALQEKSTSSEWPVHSVTDFLQTVTQDDIAATIMVHEWDW